MNKKLWTEVGVVVVTTIVANFLLTPGQIGFVGVHPHPYLIPIVALAYRYGPAIGVAGAGLLAVVYFLLGGFPPLLNWPHSGILASWLLSATLIGILTRQSRDEVAELKGRLEELESSRGLLQSQNDTLEAATRELRSRILGQSETFASLYGLARRLTTLEGEALYRSALELAAQHTGAKRCYLALRQDDNDKTWQIAAQWPANSAPRRAPGASQLVALVVQEKRTLSVRDLDPASAGSPAPGRAGSNEEPVAVTPLFQFSPDRQTEVGNMGSLVGLLVVEDLPFERFSPTTLSMLNVIADWTSRALSHLTLFTHQEELVAEENRALRDVVEAISERPLLEREVLLLRALAEPLTHVLVESLAGAKANLTHRGNLLRLLAQAPVLKPSQIKVMETVNEDQAGWLGHYFALGLKLKASRYAEELDLLLETICQTLIQVRNQVVHSQIVVSTRNHQISEREAAQAARVFVHPVAWEATAEPDQEVRDALQKMCPPQVAQAVLKVSRPVQVGGPVSREEVQEILLDLLSGQTRWLTCAALFGLSKLAQSPDGESFRAIGFGSPASEAVALCRHADPWVREAAVACLTVMHGVDRPQHVLKALLHAVSDPVAMVQRTAEAPLTASTT